MGAALDLRVDPWLFPRFRIGLSPSGYANSELINEILTFAGLDSDEAQFEIAGTHSWYTEQDFLRVNEELMRFYQQFMRLRRFSEVLPVHSVRREILMDSVWVTLAPAGSGGDGSGFSIGFREGHEVNEELIETLLLFTGIDRDNINIEAHGEVFFGWTPTRTNLTHEQNTQLDALEVFKATVNAPFWNDRYLYDPVIVNIGLDGDWNYGSNLFNLTNFIVFLYDPELLDLTDSETTLHTASLREDIITSTGVENITFRVFRPWTPGEPRW